MVRVDVMVNEGPIYYPKQTARQPPWRQQLFELSKWFEWDCIGLNEASTLMLLEECLLAVQQSPVGAEVVPVGWRELGVRGHVPTT